MSHNPPHPEKAGRSLPPRPLSEKERIIAAMGIAIPPLDRIQGIHVPTPEQPHHLGYQYALYVLSFQQAKDNSEYQRSWIKRGGKVAFANLNRKMERLDNLVHKQGQNIFSALSNPKVSDAVLDTLAYLLMHIGETKDVQEYVGQVSYSNLMIETDYGRAWKITGGVGAYADVTRKIDSLQIFAAEREFDLDLQLRIEDPKAWERVRDLVGYLMLVMGRFYAENPVQIPEVMVSQLTEHAWKEWKAGGPTGGAQGLV